MGICTDVHVKVRIVCKDLPTVFARGAWGTSACLQQSRINGRGFEVREHAYNLKP